MVQKIKKIWSNHQFLILIVLCSCIVRVWGIGFGMPTVQLEDEEFFVQPALRVASGTLDPHWYGAPAHALIYLQAIAFVGVQWLLDLVHQVNLSASTHYISDPTPFQIAGRLIVALFGVGASLFAYLLLMPYSKRSALIGAALIGGSFYLVEYSHIIRPDVPQAALLLLLWFGFYKRWPWLVGISFGLAFTMKYPSLFVAPVILLAIWWEWKHWGWKKLGLTMCIGILTIFTTAPFLFINLPEASAALARENTGHETRAGLGFIGNIWWYVSQALPWQLGTFGFLIALVTSGSLLIKPIWRKQYTALVFVVVSALAYWLGLSALNLHWERWAIPMLTLLCIPLAIGLDWLLNWKWGWIIVTLCLIAPTIRLGHLLYAYTQPHSINAAQAWVETSIVTGSKLAVEPYTPKSLSEDYKVNLLSNVGQHPLKYYRRKGYEYILLSDGIHGIIQKLANTYNSPDSSFVAAVKNYQTITEAAPLIYAEPGQHYRTSKRLLERPDWVVWGSLDQRLMLGPVTLIYKVE